MHISFFFCKSAEASVERSLSEVHAPSVCVCVSGVCDACGEGGVGGVCGGVEEGGGWKKAARMATTTATLRSGGAQPDTQVTCFTGTKVQILALRTCAMLRMDEDSPASGEVLRSKAQRCRQQHFEAVCYVALAFRYREVQVEVCRCRRGCRGRGRGSVGRQWLGGGERESDWRRHALAALRVSAFVFFFFYQESK